ncbi:MAG TPA: AI-2E family transporter [Gemmatimonadales bacterium]|nr:AI-2E family transporter [Gemmatimonadales bacterium]
MASTGTGRPDERDESDRKPGWRTRDILRTLAIIAGFYITLQVLWLGRSIVLLAFLGVLFGVALTAGVNRLERFRIPRGIGAVLIVMAFLGALAGIGALTAPSITGQLRELKTQLPEAIGKIQRWVHERQEGVNQVLEQVAPDAAPAGGETPQKETARAGAQDKSSQGNEKSPSAGPRLTDQFGGVARSLFGFFSSTLSVLGGMLLILFIAIFVAVDPEMYQGGLMHLFPHEARPRAREVLGATATMLRRWLLTQSISMVIVGLLTGGVLLVMGVEAAIALGIIAGVLEFIPIAGPIMAAVPGVAMGFLDGPEKAVYVALAYVVIQQVESNVLQPLLMKKGLELPPVLTIVTQGVLSLVFGFMGLLVAVPMLAAAIVPIKMLYVRDVVGDKVKLPGDQTESSPTRGKH